MSSLLFFLFPVYFIFVKPALTAASAASNSVCPNVVAVIIVDDLAFILKITKAIAFTALNFPLLVAH
jgi:hypothetical protein